MSSSLSHWRVAYRRIGTTTLLPFRAMDRERYRPGVVVWNYREQDIHVPLIRALVFRFIRFQKAIRAPQNFKHFGAWSGSSNPKWFIPGASIQTSQLIGRLGELARLLSVRSGVTSCGPSRNAAQLLGRLSARWPQKQICNSRTAAESVRNPQKATSFRRKFPSCAMESI